MKVLGIGEIILDQVRLLTDFPQEGSKVQPVKTETGMGGPVPTALTLLSRLGIDCQFLGSTGRDEAGQKLKKMLNNEGILVLPQTSPRTKMNTILVNSRNGSRTIIRDSVRSEPIHNISGELIRSADLIIFDRHEFMAFQEVIAKKRPDTKVIIDPSTEVSAKTIAMFRQSDYPIVPIESLARLKKHESMLENLYELYAIAAKPVIVTAGDKGSIIYDGKEITLMPAVEIPVIDTLGAGDIFRGGFAFGILQQWNLTRTTRFANLVAAMQCAKLGNSTAIPSKFEIEQFSKTARTKAITLDEVFVNFA